MQITSRAVVFATFGVGSLLLAAGCGGTSATGAQATIARIQPTSFVEIAPATTTTTTTISPEEIAASGVSPIEQTYTVRANDSISKIAGLHDITMEQLVNYNSWSDGIGHSIFVGDVVKIPPGSSVPGGASGGTASGDTGDTGDAGDAGDDATSDASSTGDCPTTYVIKAGDNTRIGVAEQFGITFEQMDAANANTAGYQNFIVGTEIIIPCP